MNHIVEVIERRKIQVASHPLYQWLQSRDVALEDRFIFAPIFVSFIMVFSDMNKWFMRYPCPRDELEKAINRHTIEDQMHSRLFLEDWEKLGLDKRLGWSASEMIEWYYASPDTEIFRQFGMEIMRMCALCRSSAVRFALMEAIEACGHVFFSVTAPVAADLEARTGKEYRYFGAYHLKRETGHVLTSGHLFEDVTLDAGQRAEARDIVNRIFDMFLIENDHLLRYAERSLATTRGSRGGDPSAASAAAPPPPEKQPRSAGGRRSPGWNRGGPIRGRNADVARVVEERMERTARHPLFQWMREEGEISAEKKLRRLVPLWTPDVMGYKDLARYALGYKDPTDRRERAINRWTAALESHHRLFLRDWSELGMDALLGWTARDTMRFCCLSEHTEVPRKNMASFIKLACANPDPILRFWLIVALESTGEAFFDSTRILAERVERETKKTLDYLVGRHHVSHPELADDAEADAVEFQLEDLSASGMDSAIAMVNAVFDSIDEQYTLTLETSKCGALYEP